MDSHQAFFTTLYDRLTTELDIINEGTKDILALTGLCIDAVARTAAALKQYVLENGFPSVEDEIRFFRSVKPKFYSLLVYYGKVFELELDRPTGSREIEVEYLKKAAAKLFYFYEKHRDFYQYYRAGYTYLDDKYFTRSKDNIISLKWEYGLDTDPNFTTGQDFIVAKIEGNEKLRVYIENALTELQPERGLVENKVYPVKKLVWTASKASLLELVYGLQSVKAFNNGNAELQQIATYFEKLFDVKLGNYHRAFQEIRERKKNRTQFLDDIKRRLIEKMDSMDDNLKH